VRAPSPFNGFAVHEFRPRPTFRAAQNDHGPNGKRGRSFGMGIFLNKANLFDHGIKSRRHRLVHGFRLVSFDKVGLVTVSGEEVNQLVIAEASKDCGIRDFVAVQMKDGKHRPIARGIQKLVGMPTGGERSRLALAVTNDAAGDQVGIVEDRAVGVHQRIAGVSGAA